MSRGIAWGHLAIEGSEARVVAVGRDIDAVGGGVGGDVTGGEHLGEDLEGPLETFAWMGRQSHHF